MTEVRTEKEIQIMRECGALLSRGLRAAVDAARPGVMLREVDAVGEQALREGGGDPSFRGYKNRPQDKPFPSALCVSVNDEVVHAPGNRDRVLKDGDIVGLDIGVWYRGLCTDMAVTIPVGNATHDALQLIAVTKQSMLDGIAAVHDGAAVSDIGRAVENYVKPYKYGIVRDFVGHGVGKKVHEDPHIPNFYDKKYDDIKLQSGMTVAIEPMLTARDWRVKTADDGWTIKTVDGSLAAHFEVTILVTKDGYELLTPLVV